MAKHPSSTHTPDCQQKLPFYVLTNHGALTDSIKRHPYLLSQELHSLVGNLKNGPNDWQAPLQIHEVAVILYALIEGSAKQNISIQIMVPKTFWDMLRPEQDQRFTRHYRFIPCLDPQAVAFEYHPGDE